MKMWDAGRLYHVMSVCVWTRAQSWVSGGWISQTVHSPYILLFAGCTAFLLYTFCRMCVCVIFNAVVLERKRHLHDWSFAHCVRMDHVWRGNRAVQSPGSALTPCHSRSFWAAAGPVGLAHPFTLGLWTEMFAVWAVPLWKNVSIRIWERQDRPEPEFLTAGMWCVYSCALTGGAGTVAFFREDHSVHVFGC